MAGMGQRGSHSLDHGREQPALVGHIGWQGVDAVVIRMSHSFGAAASP